MNILQLIPNISSGGAERFVVDLSNELVKNHNVSLVTLYDEGKNDLFRGQLSEKIKIITLGKRPGVDLRVIVRLLKVIRQERPDIIHTHLRVLNYLLPIVIFIKDISIIHTVHSDALHECPNSKIRKARGYFYKKQRITPVTISHASANNFKRVYGLDLDIMIYNGREKPVRTRWYEQTLTEIISYKKTPTSKVFINIGRLVEVKNQLMLVDAFEKLSKNASVDAILLIIGSTRDIKASLDIQRRLKQAAQENSSIFILGEKMNATDYMQAADYFCLSSQLEGMPITLIEALATGTIPICTPVGGVPETLKNLDESLLSRSIEEEDYYRALERAYFLPDDQQKMIRQKAQQLFEKYYSMKLCAEKYINLYSTKLSK